MYLPHKTRLKQADPPLAIRDEQCGFEGNPDLYGLGIRLGIYTQWLSALLVRTFHPKGIRGLTDTYIIFIFAIFVAILVITAQTTPTYTAEMLVLTYIIFGGVYTIMWSTAKPRKITQINKEILMWVVRKFIFTGLIGAVAAYCCWFWLRGMYGHSFLATPCGTHGFLFAKVSLYNRHVTRFFAALSIVLIISFICGKIRLLLDLRGYILASRALSISSRQSSQSHESLDLAAVLDASRLEMTTQHGRLTKEQRRVRREHRRMAMKRRRKEKRLKRKKRQEEGKSRIQIFLLSIAPYVRVFSLVYAVLGIELTLHWNGVTEVYSVNTVGQLIPFTIGVCGLIQTIYAPLLDRLVNKLANPERIRTEQLETTDAATMDENFHTASIRYS